MFYQVNELTLQLTITGLDRLLAVLGHTTGDLATRPAQRLESLRQDRVRVVVAGVHPVGVHGAQVLDLQFEQRRGELLGVAQLHREGI